MKEITLTPITGTTLIDLGYKPGKWFAEAINYANDHELSGATLETYLAGVAPEPVDEIEPFNEPLAYHKNIRAETELEVDNVASVVNTMNILMKTPTLVDGAVMPDACPAGPPGQIPVGGVAVARNAIHPAMHSADVCCSVMMTNFGDAEPKAILDAANAITHFGPGGRKDHFDLPEDLVERMRNNVFLGNEKGLNLAASHLGTQGDGNHFLYVGRSEATGDTIMVTHHGSRGLGAHLYRQGMKLAERFRQELSPRTPEKNAWIPFETEEGAAYWEALQIVRDWTKLNHTVIHDATKQADKTVREVFDEETVGLDVRFFTGSIDISELPSAYKNADTVQRQMEEFGLGEVVDRIMPYGCIMAGNTGYGRRRRKKKG